jgi:hypothetical protein
MQIGRYWVLLQSPSMPALFTERNRVKCRVMPLGFGWRVVVRWD